MEQTETISCLEPWLQEALDGFIDEIAEPIAADVVAERLTRTRVKASREALARYSEPRDLPHDDDSNAPTPERVAGRGSLDTGDNRKPWYVVGTVERMMRQGQIGEQEYRAAQQFYRDFTLGHAVGGLISKYGTRMGGSGTPASQQGPRTGLTPDERRTEHHNKWRDASRSIGWTRCRITNKESPGFAAAWAQTIICEDVQVVTERAPKLSDIGRAYLGVKSEQQAQAAGAAVIKACLERLAAHYGF